MVGADYGYLWSRSAENAGDVVVAEDDDGDPPDGVRTSLPLCCVDETHEMGGCSPTCFKARATAKEHRSPQPRVDGKWIDATSREI